MSTNLRTYHASCHCGSIRFQFKSEEITSGLRCNCSICIRKGNVMSSAYYPPEAVQLEGEPSVAVYQFGDKDVNHCFCRTCGIFPFNRIAKIPPDYTGPAKPGYYRINLGCVKEVDVFALDIDLVDGRSF